MNIVMVGQQSWDLGIGFNNKDMALEFSKKNNVIYVNPPLDRITVIRNVKDQKIRKQIDIIKGKKSGLSKLNAKLWLYYPDVVLESINWIKWPGLYNWINKRNNRKFADSIKKAITQLGFDEYVLFNDCDMFRSFYLIELLKPKLSVYYSRDYFQANDYYKYHGSRLEPELITKNDLCVANSPFLKDFCGRYNSNSYLVGQGCDLSIYLNSDKCGVPGDLVDIPHPIIGYVGAIVSARLDVEVLAAIASADPQWQLVLVGWEDAVFLKSKLHQYKNVHFLGSKEPGELPAYINAFDICINPQILNDFTKGNYPRKMDEYLAAGKPVVATATEAMNFFSDYAYLAYSKEDFSSLIRVALDNDSIKKHDERKLFAADHSWENSVNKVYEAIETVELQHII